MKNTTFAGLSLRRGLLLLAIAVLIPLAWLKPLDRSAESYLRDGLVRAMATYATARAFNGVISILQETVVAVQPAGVGMSFAPGQILDPVNDLVEQFSSIMLAVCVSIGIQLALLKLGGTTLVSLALTCGLLWWAFSAFTERRMTRWEARLIIAAVVVRFAVPLVATASEWAYQQTLAQQYGQTQGRLATTVDQVKQTTPAEGMSERTSDKDDWIKKFRDWLGVDTALGQVKAKYEQIRGQLDSVVEDLVHMIAIFAIQTVLLPLLFLWLIGQLASRLLLRPATATAEVL